MEINYLNDLEPEQLLAEYEKMVKWMHYDPFNTEKPSIHSLGNLESEILHRLKWCEYFR